jgi:hypothetical protein
VHVSGKVFWVLQEHGYEDETYVIAELGDSEVRYPIDFNGGGCQERASRNIRQSSSPQPLPLAAAAWR